MELTNVEAEMEQIDTQDTKNAFVLHQSSGLNLLAQYSDSEEESDQNDVKSSPKIEKSEDVKPQVSQNKYRQAESSDSSSSSSSSSEDEIDVKEIKKKLEVPASDEDSENEHENDTTKIRKKKPPIRVKGELLLEDLPPIQDLELEVDEKECLEIGTITSIVDQLVLVEAYPHSAPLDIDSVLFLDRGKKVLGKVFDVIGPVSTPIYCIRFNTHEDIVSKNITVGDKTFCAPRTEYASFVILTNIMGRGSDASWKNDVEIPENMIEYSDDEDERRAKKPHKNNNPDRQMAVPRRRSNPQNYSWHNQINNQQHPNWMNQPQQHQPHFQNYNFYPQNPYSQ